MTFRNYVCSRLESLKWKSRENGAGDAQECSSPSPPPGWIPRASTQAGCVSPSWAAEMGQALWAGPRLVIGVKHGTYQCCVLPVYKRYDSLWLWQAPSCWLSFLKIHSNAKKERLSSSGVKFPLLVGAGRQPTVIVCMDRNPSAPTRNQVVKVYLG